jgi:hypothetical protein
MKMNRSVSIKIAVLTPVVISTWFLTPKIIGRPASAADRPPAPTITIDFENRSTSQVIRTGKGAKIQPHSAGWLSSHEFRVQGNEVQVTALVDLMNTRDDTAYLWRLRAHRESDHVVVLDKPYLEQIFTIHPSGRMNPRFEELIQLPSGRHLVTLSLYGVPKDYDLTNLNDDEKAMAARLIQIPKVIEIP